MALTSSALFKGRTGLWEVCVGLEIHAQIIAKSKLFSSSSALFDLSSTPNSKASFFDAAFPGTLPTLNEECVKQTIRTALALNAKVHPCSVFERKHYFYCDLPLGYQITQQRAPIATNGVIHFPLELDKTKKHKEETKLGKVRVARIQIEQDSGKTNHDRDPEHSLVDLNRAGVALMEIVLEPDLRSPEDAGYVVRHLQSLMRHIKTCDGNMEMGSMRCDLNVSVRRAFDDKGQSQEEEFGERAEVKNVNSVRNLMKAIEFEAIRQVKHIEETGTRIERETRSFDALSGQTKRLRSKEGAKDYRFFPEPDLPPLILSPEYIENIKSTMPEMPEQTKARLKNIYGLSSYDSSVLLGELGALEYFEEVAKVNTRPVKLVANWVINNLFMLLNASQTSLVQSPIVPLRLGQLIDLIVDKTISGKIAKELIEIMFYEDNRNPMDIVEEKGWKQITDPKIIQELCTKVLLEKKNEKLLKDYANGQLKVFGNLVGQVMKTSGGKVHPELTNSILLDILKQNTNNPVSTD